MSNFESLNDALIDAVKALGGSKQVGYILWPEKSVDAAQRHLLACLNEDKPERLSPDHLLMLLRLARSKGHHEALSYILQDLGYAPTQPIEPRDENAELQRQFIESVRLQAQILERMDKAASRMTVRAVA
jgi:hypothetical protein